MPNNNSIKLEQALNTFEKAFSSRKGFTATSLGYKTTTESGEVKHYQKPTLEETIQVNGQDVNIFKIRILSSKPGGHKCYLFIHKEEVSLDKEDQFTDSNGRVFKLDPTNTKVIYKPKIEDFVKEEQSTENTFVENNEIKAHAMAMGNGGVEEEATV